MLPFKGFRQQVHLKLGQYTAERKPSNENESEKIMRTLVTQMLLQHQLASRDQLTPQQKELLLLKNMDLQIHSLKVSAAKHGTAKSRLLLTEQSLVFCKQLDEYKQFLRSLKQGKEKKAKKKNAIDEEPAEVFHEFVLVELQAHAQRDSDAENYEIIVRFDPEKVEKPAVKPKKDEDSGEENEQKQADRLKAFEPPTVSISVEDIVSVCPIDEEAINKLNEERQQREKEEAAKKKRSKSKKNKVMEEKPLTDLLEAELPKPENCKKLTLLQVTFNQAEGAHQVVKIRFADNQEMQTWISYLSSIREQLQIKLFMAKFGSLRLNVVTKSKVVEQAPHFKPFNLARGLKQAETILRLQQTLKSNPQGVNEIVRPALVDLASLKRREVLADQNKHQNSLLTSIKGAAKDRREKAEQLKEHLSTFYSVGFSLFAENIQKVLFTPYLANLRTVPPKYETVLETKLSSVQLTES